MEAPESNRERVELEDPLLIFQDFGWGGLKPPQELSSTTMCINQEGVEPQCSWGKKGGGGDPGLCLG